MKRKTALVLALALAISLTACGNSKHKNLEDLNEKDIEDLFNELDKGNSSNKDNNNGIKEIDPFEDMTVLFTPVGTLGYILPQSELVLPPSPYCTYTASVTTGLSNGDVITITAEPIKEGIILTRTQMEYKIEGIDTFVKKFDEIPKEALDTIHENDKALITQTIENTLNNDDYFDKLESIDFVGHYFMTDKSGNGYNTLYSVYKAKCVLKNIYPYDSNLEGEWRDNEPSISGSWEFYEVCRVEELYLSAADGSCPLSPYSLEYRKLPDYWISPPEEYAWVDGYKLPDRFYSVKGFPDLDTLFEEIVAPDLDRYDYETDIK